MEGGIHMRPLFARSLGNGAGILSRPPVLSLEIAVCPPENDIFLERGQALFIPHAPPFGE
jgi:hypothetical protein